MDKAKLPQRKPLRLPAYDYASPGYYFVTICTAVRNRDVLSHIVGGGLRAAPRPVLTPIGELVALSLSDLPRLNPGTVIDTYCIMPDHIHLIVALTGRHRGRPLPDIIGRMKSFTQAGYVRLGAPFGPRLWQESFYDHVLRSDPDLSETRQYIAANPSRFLSAHMECKRRFPV